MITTLVGGPNHGDVLEVYREGTLTVYQPATDEYARYQLLVWAVGPQGRFAEFHVWRPLFQAWGTDPAMDYDRLAEEAYARIQTRHHNDRAGRV